MALQTKTFKSSTVNYYHTELTLTENSVNATDNTSSVSYKLTLYAGGANFYDYSVGHTVVLAGKTISASYRPNAPQYSVEKNSSVVIASGTTTVAHNSDGTLNMSVAFSISVYKTDYTPGDISVSGVNMALTTIARASTIGATDANIESTSIINVSKKSDAYMHTIWYEFGSLSGYLDADGDSRDTKVIFPESSIAWKIPKSFYAQIPNAKSGVCTLTCTTYSVSGTTVTQIGEAVTTQMTITAAYALCAPEVSGTVYDVNEDTIALTGNRNMFVKYYSTARCILSASAKNDASISGKYINGVQVSEDIKDLPSYDGTDVKFRAEDSRGYASDVSVATTQIAYVKLTNNAVCNRTDPTSGNATLTFSGNYYNGGFGAKQNALTLKYKIDSGSEVVVDTAPTISNHTYSLSVPLSGLTYNQSHTVVVTVSDLLSTVSIRLTVKKGIPVFDWGDDDFAFHVPVTLQEPTASNHAATKNYVDNVAGGGSGGAGSGDKVVLLNAQISETNNTVQTFSASRFISTPQEGDSVLGTNGYVGIVTVVNGSQITVTATGEQWVMFDAADAVPNTRTVNGKALSEDITLTADDVSAVPNTRKVNGKELDSDVSITAGEVPYTPLEYTPLYAGKTDVKAVLDALTENDVTLGFTEADISPVAGTVTDLDGLVTYPKQPRNGEYVVGRNGYLAYADTSIASDEVAVISTGYKLIDFGGDATKDYVDNLVRIGYIDKTTEYFDSGYDNEEEFLRSLGYGRYYVSEDSTNVYTIETYYTEPYKHSTVRFYDSDGTESYKVYENDKLRLAWKRESGVYTVTSGDITIGKDAALSVPTIYADYGYKSDRAASKGYVDNKVRFGYIDMTTAAVYADRVESADDVAEYLMSLGGGRWSFNSDMDQHTEDMKIAVFVECVSTGEQKYWTVRIFEDDMSQYVRMYRQYGDDVSNRETLLDLYAEGGCPFSNLVLSSLTTDYLYVTLTPTEPTRAANKQYVDDAIADALAGVAGGNGVTLPAFTADDAGKVLKVKEDGTLYWGVDNTSLSTGGGITDEIPTS